MIRETLTVEEYGLVIAEAIREIGSVNLVLDGYSVSLRLNSVSFEYFLDLFACKYKLKNYFQYLKYIIRALNLITHLFQLKFT